MKEKGEAETIFGCRPRTLHIKKNGVMQIAEDVPGIMARYEARQLAVNEEKSYRRATISQIIYNMYLSGVFYEPKRRKRYRTSGNRQTQLRSIMRHTRSKGKATKTGGANCAGY